MKYSKHILAGTFLIIVITSCNNSNSQKEKTGEELSKTYCGSCHLFPDPALLDKRAWKDDVLPGMAKQLGIDYLYETPFSNESVITVEQWKKILAYYINTAPDALPAQQRPVVTTLTNLFIAKRVVLPKGDFPSTSYIKIDEGNHWIYAASAFDSSLDTYDNGLKLLSRSKVNAVIVDIDFTNSLLEAGRRSGILTNIGLMNPNDLRNGSLDTFSFDREGNLTYLAKIFDSIPRPVQITKYDLDGDGKQDYLVCGFGNKKGALYWMKAKTGTGFEKKNINPVTGRHQVLH